MNFGIDRYMQCQNETSFVHYNCNTYFSGFYGQYCENIQPQHLSQDDTSTYTLQTIRYNRIQRELHHYQVISKVSYGTQSRLVVFQRLLITSLKVLLRYLRNAIIKKVII